MRKTFIIAILLHGFLTAQSQVNPQISVNSNVEKVKLYIGGAQVTRTAAVNLPKGTTKLIVKDLPNTIDASTFAVEGMGDFTILSIMEGYSNEPQNLPKEAKSIKDSLNLLLLQKEDIENAQVILSEEEVFLNLNRSISGQQAGINATELKLIHEFYKSRYTLVKKEQLANKRKLIDLNKAIERLKARLYPFSSNRVSLNQELAITVMANKAGNGTLQISYYTAAAGWNPTYDIRTEGSGEPINLVLKASARNATGESWENVRFTFSTGKPVLGATPPVINPWFIRPIQPLRSMPLSMSVSRSMAKESVAFEDMELAEEAYGAGSSADFSVKQEGMLAIDYDIPIPYSLATGKDPLTVEVEKTIFNAVYEHTATPKLSTDVYLIAQIPNTESISLLNANASIYLKGAYTGTAHIDPGMVTDTITLPIGVDNGVMVERTRVKDFTSRRVIGSKVTETIGWEFTIVNKRSNPITFRLKDQVPVSTDKSIQVKAIELSGGMLDEQTGIITWNIQIDIGKIKKLKFTYSVDYPKDKPVLLE